MFLVWSRGRSLEKPLLPRFFLHAQVGIEWNGSRKGKGRKEGRKEGVNKMGEERGRKKEELKLTE